ncbi:tyrosine-type recombinase/integrase [Vibrio fluvialis]|uniref:tyrosine-type recombinase/integrase n=1 Tax=Vibrio fluvialis TaxID=676 RepID=UPI001404E036|nr:site-specific integrase [Vibrio fluvialis]NHN73797.1 site-specific integrase [Vibrio fluvialis]
MATIQARKGKKGTTYRVEFMRGGSRASKSFKLKKEAQKFAASILVDDNFADSLTNRTLTTLKFSEAVAQFLEQDQGKDLSKHQRLNHWVSIFQDKSVGKVTRQQVKSELRKLAEDKAPATVNRFKAALGSLYRYLSNEFDIDYNPVKGIPQMTENNARTRFLSNTELSALLRACQESKWDRLYLLVLMAVTTGARRTELLTLKWGSLNLKARTAHLELTKNGEQRVLTLTDGLVLELMRFRQAGGFVFQHHDSKEQYFRNFDCHWREALQAAGIKDFRFHDLRHSCASLLAMNGASLLEIAQVLGHKSITMTQRYSHLCIEHKAMLTDRVFGGIANG